MLSFECDYSTGACEEIIKKIIETNMDFEPGYGADSHTLNAIEKIKAATECPDAEVYLAVGGTETNQLVISTVLDDTEGVIAAETGHVAVHEAGAIEYSGHKVLTVPGHQGKMDALELAKYLKTFYNIDGYEHMVYPGMVYISQPTEYGSLYSKAELTAIHDVCLEYKLPLFIDGARLGYGLMSDAADFTLADIAKLCEVFYIGGTKVGALFGEAIVFTKNNMPKRFMTKAKQRGDLLAKGRFLGIQFETLFTDNLYCRLGKHAIDKKNELIAILKEAGFEFFYESPTNQQFVIIANDKLARLQEKVRVSWWEAYDKDNTVIRFATSWSTSDENLQELKTILSEI